MREEQTQPLAALGDCLAAESNTARARRDPENATAVRDYNFGIARIFQIMHAAKLNPWTAPLTIPGPREISC